MMLIKILLIITLSLIVLSLTITEISAESFGLSGLNSAEYVYKSAPDSLSNYFSNELYLFFDYNNLRFGTKFSANYPAFSSQSSIKNLNSNDVYYEWEERFLVYRGRNNYLRVGNFTEYFGSGLVLRSYEDKNFEHYTKLDGLLFRANTNWVNLKTLYGVIDSEDYSGKNDIISGVDIESSLFRNFRLGLSLASFQLVRFDNNYSTRIIAGSRVNYNNRFMSLNSEYAEMKEYRNLIGTKTGIAFYSDLDFYLGPFTITSAYKNYENFDHRMNDLPSVNYSEEPLSERVFSGYDEEGIMGQIRYIPSFYSEYFASYSEAWNSDFSLRQNDLFLEYKRYFDDIIFTAEYAHIELYDNDWQSWEKNIIPAVSFDFNWFNLPVYLRTEFGYQSKRTVNDSMINYNPLLQTDFTFSNFSLSIITETEFSDWDEVQKSPVWLGVELIAGIFENTEAKIFAGKEKGGKICRNGICSYVSDFKGLRLELETRF